MQNILGDFSVERLVKKSIEENWKNYHYCLGRSPSVELSISRAKGSLTFSANFQLIAAMNPCPCGYYGDSQKPCTCAHTLTKALQYRPKLVLGRWRYII